MWLLVCFFLSGVAGLVYQTAWTRQFAFVFGTSELAVATVLAAYMGGLAAGAAVAARLGPSLRRPVLAYGLLELGIGIAALVLVPAGIAGARILYVGLFGEAGAPPGDGGLSASLFYVAAAFLLGPEFPTILGSLFGLAVVVWAARRGFLVPLLPTW